MLAKNITNEFPICVHQVLLAMMNHPLGQQRTATTDDPNQTVPNIFEMFAENARMNCEIIHSLLSLLFQRRENIINVERLDPTTNDHRIDGNGAYRDGAVANDGFTTRVQISAGGKIHHGVRTPAFSPAKFFDFFICSG